MHRHLVERAMAGDHDAFTELARVAIGRLYAIAVLILRDPARAEDATQEALVAAWRDLPRCATRTGSTPGSAASSCVPAIARRGGPGSRPTIDMRGPSVEPAVADGSGPSPTATRSSAGSAASTPTSGRSSCCTSTSACRSRRWPMPSASRSGTAKSRLHRATARCGRRWTPTRAPDPERRVVGMTHERRRPPPHRLAGVGRARARARGTSLAACSSGRRARAAVRPGGSPKGGSP